MLKCVSNLTTLAVMWPRKCAHWSGLVSNVLCRGGRCSNINKSFRNIKHWRSASAPACSYSTVCTSSSCKGLCSTVLNHQHHRLTGSSFQSCGRCLSTDQRNCMSVKMTAEGPKLNDDMSSFSYVDFEEQLCALLGDGTGKVYLSRLIRGIRNSGLWRNDPRLTESFTHMQQYLEGVTEQTEVLIDSTELRRCIKENIVLIRRAFVGDFVIPEFSKFCSAIDDIYWACRANTGGQVANYIQPLSLYSPDYWGVSLCTIDGQRHAIGDTEVAFTVQASGKPINYALAINELSADLVHQYVGHEPSGESFTSIKLNQYSRPYNPLVNAGSLVITSLMHSSLSMSDRFERIMTDYRRMCGGEHVSYNNAVFLSERDVGDRNYALGYFLRDNKCFPDGINLHEIMDLYFQLCSIEINVNSGAIMAATLANGGFCPITGEKVLSSTAVRNTLSLMHSCGMYDYSGGFAFTVGLPGKSGLSGGILLVIPNVLGMCLWSPPLDPMGNSVRGIQFCEQLVRTFNFHHYDSFKSAGFDPRMRRSDYQGGHVVKLLFSAYNGDVTALRRMRLAGRDMTVIDYDGRSALHVAASEGHLDCVRFLLDQCKVPPCPVDRWGSTPQDDAVRFGHNVVAKFIEKATVTYMEKKQTSLSV